MALKSYLFVVMSGCLSLSTSAMAWDPLGDIAHPDRIIRNVERETNNAVRDIPNVPRNVGRELDNFGRELDQARLNAQAEAAAPILENWITQSRNSAIGQASPMPPYIRQQLQGFYDDDVLNRARFKVGDTGAFNIGGLTLQYGDNVNAITLIDLIIFQNQDLANDPTLWAHELKHVEQYRDWGTHSFAVQYIRSWNGVENPAYAAQNAFPGWSLQRQAQVQSNNPPNQSLGRGCATQFGACFLMQPDPVGQPCFCPGPPPANGQVIP